MPPVPKQDLLVVILERRPDIVGAYLFGSRARGEAREGSDLDLAVYCERPLELDELIGLETELERATGLPVNVIDLRQADTFLALEAIRGERILERDGRRLDELDLDVLRRAGDLAPFERERRRLLLGTHPA
jgi:hypothetical protein